MQSQRQQAQGKRARHDHGYSATHNDRPVKPKSPIIRAERSKQNYYCAVR
jgi:hypothetical protein